MAIYNDGLPKEHCRKIILDRMSERLSSAFTLPSESLTFEQRLTELNPNIRLVGAEWDTGVWSRAQEKANRWRLPISIMRGEDLNVLKSAEQQQFQLMWLDWCGSLTSNRIDYMRRIARGLHSCQYLAVTILAAREPAGNLPEAYARDRASWITTQLRSAATRRDRHCHPLHIVRYHSHVGDYVSSPMLFMLFQFHESKYPVLDISDFTRVEHLVSTGRRLVAA